MKVKVCSRVIFDQCLVNMENIRDYDSMSEEENNVLDFELDDELDFGSKSEEEEKTSEEMSDDGILVYGRYLYE